MIRRLVPLALAATIAMPALAVGLGPLSKSGITDAPRKGFYLTVINPYPRAEQFELSPVGVDDEVDPQRVTIIPARVTVAAGSSRKVLVIANALEPGETFAFRVCAEKPQINLEVIHARVCSKLSARRVARP